MAGSYLLANFPFAEVGKGTVRQFMQVLIGGIQPPGRLLWCVDRRELWQVLPLPSQLTLGLTALESAALVVVLVSVLIVVPPSTPTTTTAPLRKPLKISRPGVTRTHDQGIMGADQGVDEGSVILRLSVFVGKEQGRLIVALLGRTQSF